MTLQHIVVYIIGLAVVIWVGRRLHCRLCKQKGSKCNSCNDGSCPHAKQNRKQ